MARNPNEDPTAIHKCDSCLSWHREADIVPLDQVPRLGERLDPGSTVPSGECPACGALTYLDATPLEKWYRIAAQQTYAGDDYQVDDDAKVALAKNGKGAWIQAWVWLSDLRLPRSSDSNH